MTLPKILCVIPGMGSSIVADVVKTRQWDVVIAADLASAQRVQARHDIRVGLMVLAVASADDMDCADACVQWFRSMEWIGVFPEEALGSPLWRERVLRDFLDHHTLPLDWQALSLTLNAAFRRARLRRWDSARPDTPDIACGANALSMGMVGCSAPMLQLQREIRKVAATGAPVLIAGESGSGKELAARAVHQSSRRAAAPFVAVNCGAIAPALIQSELFGHERGAFTGAITSKQGLIESARDGTIFLDEVGDLPLELQTNLLRFLQEHTIQRVGSTHCLQVDARVVAASHIDLAEAVAAGRFREDLFYRLNVLPLTVPPLRERMVDVPVLAQHFLQRCLGEQRQRRVDGFNRPAVAAMMAHSWPGNVRELHNRVHRAFVMTDQRLITPADLMLGEADAAACIGLQAIRTLAERDAISLTLGRVGRNVTHAARELGISRMTLYRLIDKHRLLPPA